MNDNKYGRIIETLERQIKFLEDEIASKKATLETYKKAYYESV